MRDSVVGHRHRPPRDNRSHAASEGRYRGSDLAVTAPELNAGAGVGRLWGTCPILGRCDASSAGGAVDWDCWVWWG